MTEIVKAAAEIANCPVGSRDTRLEYLDLVKKEMEKRLRNIIDSDLPMQQVTFWKIVPKKKVEKNRGETELDRALRYNTMKEVPGYADFALVKYNVIIIRANASLNSLANSVGANIGFSTPEELFAGFDWDSSQKDEKKIQPETQANALISNGIML